jgi:hypothetical protein
VAKFLIGTSGSSISISFVLWNELKTSSLSTKVSFVTILSTNFISSTFSVSVFVETIFESTFTSRSSIPKPCCSSPSFWVSKCKLVLDLISLILSSSTSVSTNFEILLPLKVDFEYLS